MYVRREPRLGIHSTRLFAHKARLTPKNYLLAHSSRVALTAQPDASLRNSHVSNSNKKQRSKRYTDGMAQNRNLMGPSKLCWQSWRCKKHAGTAFPHQLYKFY